MPTVVMATTKGGSGKTTTALILAGELVAAGARVVLLEGDRNRALSKWAEARSVPVVPARHAKIRDDADAGERIRLAAGDEKLVVLASSDDDEDLFSWIGGASSWAHFVIVDPEGSKNEWMSDAVTQADYVLIPFATTHIEAEQVAVTVAMIRKNERKSRRNIPYGLVVVRAKGIMTREERSIRTAIEEQGLPLLSTPLFDRAAYSALFSHKALLSELTSDQVSGLDRARENAFQFCREVVKRIEAATNVGVAA